MKKTEEPIKTTHDNPSDAKKERKASWGQILRIGFAGGLLLIVAFVYVPHLFFTYSISAIVSAPVIHITSPIEGILKDAPPPMGTQMKADDIIGIVENARFDRKVLDDLLTDMKATQERIAALKEEKGDLDQIKVDLQKSYNAYKESLEERVSLDIDRAKKRLNEIGDTISESKAEFNRKSKLYTKGHVAENQADKAYFTAERASKTADQAMLDVQRLEAQLRAIQAGIFVNTDGRTDVPYQQQRMDDISMRQHDLESRIQEFTIREAALKQAVDLEEARYKKMSEATIKTPFNSVSWRVFGSKGSHVDTTRPILEVVDCSRVFVSASVHERYYNAIKPGDPATIKLVGDKKILKGIVQSVRGGSVSESSTAFLAGASQVLRPHEIEVIISIPEIEVTKGKGDYCFVGRTGEVVFDNLGMFGGG